MIFKKYGHVRRKNNLSLGLSMILYEDNRLNFDYCNIFWFQNLTGQNSPITAVNFNISDELLLAGSQAGVIKLWDLQAAKSTLVYINFG